MNRLGNGPQPLRSIPGSVYASQQGSAARNTNLGSSRLQNGKSASSVGWALPYNPAGTTGLPNTQSRNNGFPSFAQTIGGNQTHASLDPSEFPSLSGTSSQPHQQSAIWGSAGGLRGQQLSNPQRAGSGSEAHQPSPSTIQPPSQTSEAQRRSESIDNQGFSQQLGYGGYGPGISGQGNRQAGGSDDFPPLTDGATALGRRTASGQPTSPDALGGVGIGRLTGQSPAEAFEQQSTYERVFSPNEGVSRATPISARSPLDESMQRMDQNAIGRPNQNAQGHSNGLPIRTNGDQQRWSPMQQTISDQATADGSVQDNGSDGQMSEQDRWGLPGLLEMVRPLQPGNDRAALSAGHSLEALGLNLNRSGSLYADWAGPFADQDRPVIPDFTLPAAYTIKNVPKMEDKVGSFSDDTLFMIFYQYPRDMYQYQAANELYSRDWRWHIKLQQWMMKAKDFPEPQSLANGEGERGMYEFWNPARWAREKVNATIRLDDVWNPSRLLVTPRDCPLRRWDGLPIQDKWLRRERICPSLRASLSSYATYRRMRRTMPESLRALLRSKGYLDAVISAESIF